MSTESDNTFEKNAKEQIELLDKQRTQVMKEANADYLVNVASMHKSLSDFTADTQVEAAALSGISDLPFDKLIGGPLSAVIAAQSEAANATLKFIQAAGIRNDKVVVVSFDYVKDGVLRKFQIPLLTLVPIPSFTIKSLDYEFKVKVKAESSANASIST